MEAGVNEFSNLCYYLMRGMYNCVTVLKRILRKQV